MIRQVPGLLRRATTIAAIAVVFALMAPSAFAGGGHHGSHHRGGSHGGSYHGSSYRGGYSHRGYAGYRPAVSHYGYRRPVHVVHRYPVHGGHYGGSYPAGYYGGYYRSRHWHAGDVLGALVAGAVITSVIADAVTPRTTVIERRVVSDPYYSDEVVSTTRYVGPDDGYYGQR